QVDVAEQLARSIVAAAHASSPNLVGVNESWSPVDGERLFQQPARSTRRQFSPREHDVQVTQSPDVQRQNRNCITHDAKQDGLGEEQARGFSFF
ncbi:hypothetical protein, partial [Bradyrhizobium jicamae]|uniref:hypothetical protein n=1 Tax=Bradyrhizobium jicamae TaxID=280332 RepID=UPI001BADAD5F